MHETNGIVGPALAQSIRIGSMTDVEKNAQPSRDEREMDKHSLHDLFGRSILWVRWLQLPLLIGLVVALILFEISFAGHLLLLFFGSEAPTREKAILVILDLIDMVLIANLVVMVVISGYNIFISPLVFHNKDSVPSWLRGQTLGSVKIKITATVLLISTINLLHEILNPSIQGMQEAAWLLSAQIVLVITTFVLSVVERRDPND